MHSGLEIFVFGLLLAFVLVFTATISKNRVFDFEEAFIMSTFRATLIAAAVLAMTSCAAFAQVRVIGPDSEHVYSPDPRDGGRLLDDEALQRENERKQRAKMEREYQRDQALRQQELDAAAAQAAPPAAYDEPYGPQDGSYYGGTFRNRQGRHVNLRQIRTGSVSGNSFRFRHAITRVHR
jgi:hypothetical protein